MDDVLNRCVLVTDHHSYHTSFSKDELKDVIESKGCCLDKLIPLTGCNSNNIALAILKDHKDVDKIITSKSSYPNLHFEQFLIVEDVQTDVCTIELSETIAELAKSLNSQEFHTLQKTSTSIGDVLLVFGDLSDNLFLASVLTEKIGEYLKAVYNAEYVNVENPSETKTIDDVISQSFVVTGFPAGTSKDKIQIALQRTKDGGGEVECIYPDGLLKKSAIAIFSDSHVADKLKAKGEMNSVKFPGHTLQMKALTDYGDLGSQYIQIKGFKKYESIEKTKEKLIINLQSQSTGGGDVKDTIYPVGQAEDIALVEFYDNLVSDNLLQKKTITAKDGAVIHFKKVMSLVKCVKRGVIGQVNESALQIYPEIKDALNKKEGIKWASIGKNKYLFYTQDYLQELRCFAAEHIMESCEGTPDNYRQNDVKYPPKHEEKIHSAERLPPSMRTEGAGISGWKSGDVKMSEKSGTSKHCPILIEDVEYNLFSGTKLVIHHGDITNEDVDVIVNAANGNLYHGGGVALAIAQKAGPELEREGDDILRRRGCGLSVGNVTVTKGYNLKAKHVIHAVGPNKWDNKRSFRSDLLGTFRNCLECANTDLNAKAIALPLISAGIFGGNVQVCAEELSNALIAFRNDSALCKQPGLREIRIVDNNIEVILTIQDTFKVFAESPKKRNVESDSTEEDMECIQSKEKGGRATGEYHMRAASQKRKSPSSEDIKCCLCKRPAPNVVNLDCNHPICASCLLTLLKNRGKKNCPACKKSISDLEREKFFHDDDLKKDLEKSNASSSRGKCTPEEGESDSRQQEKETCVICLDDFSDNIRELPCKHKFCRDCIDQAFKVKPVCPSCGMICGEMKGNQPPGTMNTIEQTSDLPDYAGRGTIQISYYIPSGTQTEAHPNPGKRFQGTHRTAYLPNNAEGKHVAKLLQRAFDARLIFTVGTSTTSGSSNVVTWNDIHHKTNTYGGPERYGYPDPTYLKRVKAELAAKGIE